MERVSTYPRVIIDAVWPNAGIVRDTLLVLVGSLLIALAAQIHIPLPFSPVPITGQTFAVLLLGALYGSRRGATTSLTYLTLGLIGLPFFAGGAAGVGRLLGPTGGYLLGYIPAAFVVGWLSERGWDRRLWSTAAGMAIGNAIIYVTGVMWLGRFVAADVALRTGVLPFLPGDALKIVLATSLLPAAWRLIGRPGRE